MIVWKRIYWWRYHGIECMHICYNHLYPYWNDGFTDYSGQSVHELVITFHKGKQGCYQLSLPNLRCSKTCLTGLLIRSIFRGKNCTSASARVQFFSEKPNELKDQQDMFCFNHVSAFYTINNIVKDVNEWQIQGTNSNRKSYRKLPLTSFSVTCFKHVM